MARKKIIKHPDGTTTEITEEGGCLSGCFTFLAVVVVIFAPAAWWGLWSIPVYVVLTVLLAIWLYAKLRQHQA